MPRLIEDVKNGTWDCVKCYACLTPADAKAAGYFCPCNDYYNHDFDAKDCNCTGCAKAKAKGGAA